MISKPRLIAITGPVDIGKTVFLCMQDEIAKDKKVTVAESLSVDKARTTVPTLIAALFYGLSRAKERRFRPRAKSAIASCKSWSWRAEAPQLSERPKAG
ncbi:hypothetical protein [Mesorhizobium sp. L-2-11]|uniref:hypothetical protein n=1 Tax=Mesorhizobium sp. L-2-11 TaxID=2744521 RepID=UPI0018EA62DE|nr:hypothetical protein [Mesorhizobium sp. L-2-11]BCH20127.1 hypothetical protein MesoLjLa_69780 [Mesorhizobium sp. L-2-11]